MPGRCDCKAIETGRTRGADIEGTMGRLADWTMGKGGRLIRSQEVEEFLVEK